MTEINATPRAVEQRLADTLDALLMRDARVIDTLMRLGADGALVTETREDMSRAHIDLFDVLLAVRNLPRSK